jgi:predicted DNA-binding protein with PD1-like motif
MSSVRHLLLRLGPGARLPESLVQALTEHGVACGWVRASGVLEDVELRAIDPRAGSLGSPRLLSGAWLAASLEGSVGLDAGRVSSGLRGVLAQEGERGLDTVAGELASAKVVGLELFVTALDETAVARSLDARSGVALSGEAAASASRTARVGADPSPAPRAAPAPAPKPEPPPAWGEAIEASAEVPPIRTLPKDNSRPLSPPRPPRAAEEAEQQMPEAGDIVEHFAFGRCEVLKSDGERLHLKVGKDGRIREIALEMLRVVPLESSDESRRRFRLERKM